MDYSDGTKYVIDQGFSFLPEVGGQLDLEKNIWAIKFGKLELDCHFKWIKKHLRN